MGVIDPISVPVPLQPEHELDAFSCGIPELNEWLRDRARRNDRQDVSRTFVASRGTRVVGCYTLAAGVVTRIDAPKPLTRNSPDLIPVLLPGRLAVDQREQGTGLGGFLLRDALLRCLKVTEAIGARAVMVDAISDDAIAFYRRYEFVASPINPALLFLPISFIRRQFEDALQ